jgi:hypothetical protein
MELNNNMQFHEEQMNCKESQSYLRLNKKNK